MLVKNDPERLAVHKDIGQLVLVVEWTTKPTAREAEAGDLEFREERPYILDGSYCVLAAHRD